VRRHPSSARAGSCDRCGFTAPARRDLPAEIAAIPWRWRELPARSTSQRYRALTLLASELQLAADRISWICARPGVPDLVGSTEADGPEVRGAVARRLAALDVLAEHLALVLAGLDAREWSLVGEVGGRHLSVAELALLPLHRSHSRIDRELAWP
jgi:hypothetical protein